MPTDNHCGFFDNGFDTKHEHRLNCRRCLLERIDQLTKDYAALKYEFAVEQQRRGDAEGEIRSMILERRIDELCNLEK